MGDPAAPGRTFPAIVMSKAWMTGQIAVSTNPVYILRQVGTGRFLVTDGTVSGTVRLSSANPASAGQGAILVTPYAISPESGAIFTFTYKALSAAVDPANQGTGYVVNDTVTMTNGTVLTVATIGAAGALNTVTVSAAGSRGTVSNATATGVSQTASSGAGTGAKFNLNFGLNTATVSSGTGYSSGESIVFVGLTAITSPTATISGVSAGGVPTGVTIGSIGSGITVSASSGAGSWSSTPQYARTIKNRSVRTWEGNGYTWDPFNTASAAGQADLPKAGTGSEATTYMLANQNALASGAPDNFPIYGSKINAGPTSQQMAVFATGGTPGGNGNAARPRTVVSPDATHPMGVGRMITESTYKKEEKTTESIAHGKTHRNVKKTTDTSQDHDATNANTSET